MEEGDRYELLAGEGLWINTWKGTKEGVPVVFLEMDDGEVSQAAPLGAPDALMLSNWLRHLSEEISRGQA
jgi:hypothetical protein